METDFTRLTFLADPLAYQVQANEVCARVPAGITSAEELSAILKDGLGFPWDVKRNWQMLSDVLGNWDRWPTIPQRMVIQHLDLPLVHSGRLWWLDVQGYLHALLSCLFLFEQRNALQSDPLKHKELVVIFPSAVYEEIQAVLTRPPDWELSPGIFEYDAPIGYEIAPSSAQIFQALRNLDGVTSDNFTLHRKDAGSMVVQYNKHATACYIEYTTPDSLSRLVASTEAPPFPIPPLLSLEEASRLVETFFMTGQRSSEVHWSDLSQEDYAQLQTMRERWYYRSAEEALVELYRDWTRSVVGKGVAAAAGRGEQAFSLAYWKNLLSQPDASLAWRLTALCVVGLSDLPEAPELLHPFLFSPVKQERWVSARFCGLWGDEGALPVLLSMLTDELPFTTRPQETDDEGGWYDNWRDYAPRLLRNWPTEQVGAALHDALTLWVEAAPQFEQIDPTNPDYDFWEQFKQQVCFELGYREAFAELTDLKLNGEHQKDLQTQMERGYLVKRLHMTAEEEYTYLRFGIEPKR